jgi:hypothetical protein
MKDPKDPKQLNAYHQAIQSIIDADLATLEERPVTPTPWQQIKEALDQMSRQSIAQIMAYVLDELFPGIDPAEIVCERGTSSITDDPAYPASPTHEPVEKTIQREIQHRVKTAGALTLARLTKAPRLDLQECPACRTLHRTTCRNVAIDMPEVGLALREAAIAEARSRSDMPRVLLARIEANARLPWPQETTSATEPSPIAEAPPAETLPPH